MSGITESLDNMVIRVTSPDGQIMARLHNLSRVTIAFRPKAYQAYRSTDLETQLAAALNTLWQTYDTATKRAFDAAGTEILDPAEHWDKARRRYYTELNSIDILGVSPGNCVKLRSHSTSDFEFKIKPETLESLSETAFVAEIDGALSDWLADRQHKSDQVLDKHFDVDRPSPNPVKTPHRVRRGRGTRQTPGGN